MTEQSQMQRDPHQYIKSLEVPKLKFADSEDFQKELERVNKKIADKQNGQVQNKKKEITYP